MELALLQLLSCNIDKDGSYRHRPGSLKAIYLAPSKALVQVSCQSPCALYFTPQTPLSIGETLWTWLLQELAPECACTRSIPITESLEGHSVKYVFVITESEVFQGLYCRSKSWSGLSFDCQFLYEQRIWVLLCQERVTDWSKKFGSILGVSIIEVSGDTEVDDATLLDVADVICTTPEKFGEKNTSAEGEVRMMNPSWIISYLPHEKRTFSSLTMLQSCKGYPVYLWFWPFWMQLVSALLDRFWWLQTHSQGVEIARATHNSLARYLHTLASMSWLTEQHRQSYPGHIALHADHSCERQFQKAYVKWLSLNPFNPCRLPWYWLMRFTCSTKAVAVPWRLEW